MTTEVGGRTQIPLHKLTSCTHRTRKVHGTKSEHQSTSWNVYQERTLTDNHGALRCQVYNFHGQLLNGKWCKLTNFNA